MEGYKNITPQDAKRIQVLHRDWQTILQDEIDACVPSEAMKNCSEAELRIVCPPETIDAKEALTPIIRDILFRKGWLAPHHGESFGGNVVTPADFPVSFYPHGNDILMVTKITWG